VVNAYWHVQAQTYSSKQYNYLQHPVCFVNVDEPDVLAFHDTVMCEEWSPKKQQ